MVLYQLYYLTVKLTVKLWNNQNQNQNKNTFCTYISEKGEKEKSKMTTLLTYLMQLISSFFLGVSYVSQTQDKVFLKDNYYQGEVQEVDYLSIYKSYETRLSAGEEPCNLHKYLFDSKSMGKKIQDGVSNGYLFYATKEEMTLEDALQRATYDSDLKAYIVKVPRGTKIVAPYNCTLDNSSLTATDNMYPDDTKGKTMGSYIRLVTDETTNGQYRITIGSIARHWCCMNKRSPKGNLIDGDTTTPYYEHTFTPDRTFRFSAGDVIAEAGQSGATTSMRKDHSDTAYIFIRVEGKSLTGGYSEIDIQKLYEVKE